MVQRKFKCIPSLKLPVCLFKSILAGNVLEVPTELANCGGPKFLACLSFYASLDAST